MKSFNIDEEYEKVKAVCEKYGFECILRFDEIYIKTAYESWYFIHSSTKIITLMHGNGMGRYPNGYHVQFSRPMSYEDMVTYIREHGLGKFRGFKMNYTFDKKTGKRLKKIRG